MALLDRIANYFKEWDGIDETAPKMELSIHDLRYIADMNVERCRLIRQLNEANFKTEEIRNKAIDEMAEKISLEISESIIYGMLVDSDKDNSFSDTADKIVDYVTDTVKKIAEKMKGGADNV